MGFLPGSFEQRLHIGFKIVDLHIAFQRLVLCVYQGTPGWMRVYLPYKYDLDFLSLPLGCFIVMYIHLLERLGGMGTLFSLDV